MALVEFAQYGVAVALDAQQGELDSVEQVDALAEELEKVADVYLDNLRTVLRQRLEQLGWTGRCEVTVG